MRFDPQPPGHCCARRPAAALPALDRQRIAAPSVAETKELLVDIWGWCRDCDDWFACDGWFDPAVPQPCCPRCRREPAAIENRGAARRVIAQLASGSAVA